MAYSLYALVLLVSTVGAQDAVEMVQIKLSGQVGSATNASIGQGTEDYETLVKELAYLAGGVATHYSILTDTMGWAAGAAVVHTSGAALDTMQVYTKESACAVVFSATDDAEDGTQQLLGSQQPLEFCGLPDVNAGYAQEMQQYMEQAAWAQALGELGACAAAGKTIYATGHSMGGAMASVFAFCVNTKDDYAYKYAFGGGQLPEIHLVTFSAPAPSKTPLYNGVPGNCFEGTRRYVFVAPSSASQQFHIDNLNNFAQLAGALGDASGSAQLQGAATQLATLDYPSAAATFVIQSTSVAIGPMWLIATSIMTNQTIPGLEALVAAYPTFQQLFGAMLQTHAESLIYNYDPVPQLFYPYSYRHPLIKAEPQAHSVKGGSTIAQTACAEASDMPNEDYPQLNWGIMFYNAANLGSIFFPNHGMCCLIPDSDCSDRFTGHGSGIDCTDLLAAATTAATTAAPANNSGNETMANLKVVDDSYRTAFEQWAETKSS